MAVHKAFEEAISRELQRNPQATRREIADAVGIGSSTVDRSDAWRGRQWRSPKTTLACRSRVHENANEPAPIVHEDVTTPPSADEYLDHAERAASMEARERVDPPHAALVVPFAEPAVIVVCGDLHAGSHHTDHSRIRALFDLAKRPRWYVLNLGDDCQNKHYAGHMSATLKQGLTPQQQRRMMLDLYRENPHKWLKVPGNHERADLRSIGYDGYTQALSNAGVKTLGSPAILRIVVGGQEYTGTVAHKFRGGGLHPCAPALRLMQRFCPTADFSFTAHRHRPALVQHHAYDTAADAGLGYGGRKVLGMVGTAQTLRDDYGAQFGDGGTWAALTMVLHPDRHEVVAFWSPQHAEAYLRGL